VDRSADFSAGPAFAALRFLMRILFIGDIVGSPGRQIVRDDLGHLLEEQRVDVAIANCENAAAGFGITPRLADELLAAGVEVLSGGNHIFDKKEILDYIPNQPRLVRPANFPPGVPGSGVYVGKSKAGVAYALLNLQGRVFMPSIDCPFRTADLELEKLAALASGNGANRPDGIGTPNPVKIILVDFHAEATSEKQAMGWYLDGRVTAVLGTHTHVATADEQILPKGTAYITDVGMTGPHDSVIGMNKQAMVRRFLDSLPARFEVADGDSRLNAVVIDADESTGLARSISRVHMRLK
jgi:metallophosphoesterase (TIGR00282 family)